MQAIWLTGLSGAGKTTIANKLHKLITPSVVLDGDVIRSHISFDLGFSKEDRDKNVLRVAHIARLFIDSGVTPIIAMISPYRLTREDAYHVIGDVVEVYCNAPLEVCRISDVKGLYVKDIKGFTGTDDPYEPPTNPSVTCEAYAETVKQSVQKILYEL